MSTTMTRFDALDTMKAVGMTLIVYGHVAHATTVALTPPIYLKQFGVAFFLFAAGFTLARERRPAVAALSRRLAPVYGYGLSLALFLTALGATTGTGLALSNFLPFLGGVNVVRDSFPANPTTWYVGTYVHALLLWALVLRRIPVGPRLIAVVLVVEIPLRVLLIQWAGPYVAYMLMTNWMSVFLLGICLGARQVTQARNEHQAAMAFGAALAVFLTASAAVFWNIVPVISTFPFMTASHPGWGDALMVSAGISWLYLGTTALVFAVARRVQAPAVALVISRNSLVIFLAHMPVFYALAPVLARLGLTYWPRVAVQSVVCLFGLALLSEAIRAVVRASSPRERFSLGISTS